MDHSPEEAGENPQGSPWFRPVYANRLPVGFVMLSWDVQPQLPKINGPVPVLLIDHRHQGQGYGREVVQQMVKLVREQGATELLTSHVPGQGGPAGYHARLGLVPRGDLDPNAEIILRLDLRR